MVIGKCPRFNGCIQVRNACRLPGESRQVRLTRALSLESGCWVHCTQYSLTVWETLTQNELDFKQNRLSRLPCTQAILLCTQIVLQSEFPTIHMLHLAQVHWKRSSPIYTLKATWMATESTGDPLLAAWKQFDRPLSLTAAICTCSSNLPEKLKGKFIVKRWFIKSKNYEEKARRLKHDDEKMINRR